jgi:hypothetical protein
MNFSYLVIGIVFILGIFSVITIFDQVNSTGSYVYGSAGMGRYYAAGGWVQFKPKEACEYAGANSFEPPQITFNAANTASAVCYFFNPYDSNDRVAVPLVQWVTPTPIPGQYSPRH